MTKVDEILEELRRGTPLKEIRSKYVSQSQLYEAFRLYFAEADREIQNRQIQLASLNSEVRDRQNEATSLNKQVTEAQGERAKTESDIAKLQGDMAKLEGQLKQRRTELDSIRDELSNLEKAGITKGLIGRVSQMEVESGQELLQRVGTAKDYAEVQRSLIQLNAEKVRIQQEIADLSKTKEGLSRDIQSERNILDESERKTATFREAVNVTVGFFQEGYATQDLKSLAKAIKLLSIKDDPQLSIERLVRGLERAKALGKLEEGIKEKEKELETLNASINTAKGELRSMRGTVLKEIHEANTQAAKQIEDTARQAAEDVTSTGRVWQDQIQKVDQKALASLDQYHKEVLSWGELMRKAGETKEQLDNANLLLGILKYPETVKKLPMPIVAQVMNRIYLWTRVRLPDQTMKPSYDIYQKDFNLNYLTSYKLPVVFEWCKEELERRVDEEAARK